jgi:hypothetical protein
MLIVEMALMYLEKMALPARGFKGLKIVTILPCVHPKINLLFDMMPKKKKFAMIFLKNMSQ